MSRTVTALYDTATEAEAARQRLSAAVDVERVRVIDKGSSRELDDYPIAGEDRHAVALNQVIRYRGRYYGVYHANADPEWKGPWTTCLAVSDDLVRWTKYPANPVIRSDSSRC